MDRTITTSPDVEKERAAYLRALTAELLMVEPHERVGLLLAELNLVIAILHPALPEG